MELFLRPRARRKSFCQISSSSIHVKSLENKSKDKKEKKGEKKKERSYSQRYGTDLVCDVLVEEIRRNDMPCIDPFDPACNLTHLIQRVQTSAERNTTSATFYIGRDGGAREEHNGPLFRFNTTCGALSTMLNGHERLHQRVTERSPTPADNWANDVQLKKSIKNNLCNAKIRDEVLSRNRLRVNCMQMNGCKYPTAFPIDIALAIYNREAARLSSGMVVIDPCAGWSSHCWTHRRAALRGH